MCRADRLRISPGDGSRPAVLPTTSSALSDPSSSSGRADPVSVSGVERAVLDAARRFPGLVVRADPWQMKGSMERLERAGVRIRGFDFTAGSVQRLSTVLYSLITSATLRVYPNAELEREVLGLRVVQKAGGWRLDHAAGGYSDRVMALALAVLDVPTGPPEPSVQYSMIDGLDLRVGEQLAPGVVVDPWFAEDYPDGP